MNESIKWAAELPHVREVSLLGAVDLAFWTSRLQPEGLVPLDLDGRARVLIVAADSRYMGVPFRELSFSIFVTDPADGTHGNAAYLLHAFNSSRFFAFCERTFFSTPYSRGDVMVSAVRPVSVELSEQAKCLFSAQLHEENREPSSDASDGWDGRIYLPRKRRADRGEGKLFFARIRGITKTFDFEPSQDQLTISPSASTEVLRTLRDSGFVAQQWKVREDAAHSKSKTYSRSDAHLRAGTADS